MMFLVLGLSGFSFGISMNFGWIKLMLSLCSWWLMSFFFVCAFCCLLFLASFIFFGGGVNF